MNHTPKVSVIIPVYGVENYIERCARSLFEQTLEDIEYIFINDCTPDKSVEILLQTLEDYPHRKSQVRVITMEQNSGQAAVRKRGMLEAKGEYQIHCDSDDWVEPDMYERLYAKAKETDADIVTCNFWMENGGGGVNSEMVKNIDNPDPHYHINNVNTVTWWTLWCRLIRSCLIIRYQILPIPGLNMWEDVLVNLQAYYYANIISHIEEPFYHYDITREGRMVAKQYDELIIQQQVSCINHLECFFKTVEYDANDFLQFRKCRLKSKFLLMKKVDYMKFKECFPDVIKNPYINKPFEKYAWEKAAVGNFFPYKIWKVYKFLSNVLAYIVRKLRNKTIR